MTNYRRAYVPGATYFFTVNLANRDSALLVERIDDLRNAVRYARDRHPFEIDAMAVLPEHIHALWTLPSDDIDYALRWRLLKTWFSRQVPRGERRGDSRIARGERGIWQRRYWEHVIRDEERSAPHRLYSFQCGQTSARGTRGGLAVFNLSSFRRRWAIGAGLGRWRRRCRHFGERG